jgi:hypothetical protein
MEGAGEAGGPGADDQDIGLKLFTLCGHSAGPILTEGYPTHPRCDGKSAQATESKWLAGAPLRKRVRKRKKQKELHVCNKK